MEHERLVRIFRDSLYARRFEERVTELVMAGELPGTLHPGAGQEVAQCAALSALRPDDKVLYGHRGVAYMLARGTPPAAILADIAGKVGGTNNGKGGIMHVVDVEHGVLGESGTLGGGFVVAAGVGLALRAQGGDQVVVHFFGDGTSNRGTFHESLNFCALKRLPVIFLCENNGWAVSVPVAESTAVTNIADRAQGYGVPGVVVDGSDAPVVAEAMDAAVARARAGDGPTLLEVKVTRLLGHHMGDRQQYRFDRDEVAERDPLPRLQQALLDAGALDEATLERFEEEIRSTIDAAVAELRQAPLLPAEAALQDLYV